MLLKMLVASRRQAELKSQDLHKFPPPGVHAGCHAMAWRLRFARTALTTSIIAMRTASATADMGNTIASRVKETVLPEVCSECDELTADRGKVAGELTVVGGKVAGELTVVGGKVAGELTVVGGKVAGELTVVGSKVDGGAVEGPAIKSISLKLGHCNPER